MSIFSVGAGGAEKFSIDQSLRFNDFDSACLSKAFGAAGNNKIYTLSFWVKRSKLSDYQSICSTYTGSTHNLELVFDNTSGGAGDRIDFYYHASGSFVWGISTVQEFRDPSAWYHFVLIYDSTGATQSDYIRMYVDGARITALAGSQGNAIVLPAQNVSGELLDNKTLKFGCKNIAAYFGGYMAELFVLDGQAQEPSTFGETDPATGQWIPKDSTDITDAVTFGTNGFYLPFSSSQLSTDIKNLDEATGHSVRPFGNANTSTAYKQFGTASALFDGTGDYLACSGNHNSFIAPGSDFTIEFWLRWDGVVGSGNFTLMDNRANTPNNGGWAVFSTGTYLGFDYSDGITWASRLVATTAISTTAFQHYAIVHTGNTTILYVDGTQEDIETGVPMRNNNGIYNYLYMGGGYNNSGSHSNDEYCDCYLDEVRISNIARYTGASITVPTSAFTDDTNTQLLMHMDGTNGGTTFTSSATKSGRHNILPGGLIKMSQAQTKVSNASIYFDNSTGGDFFGAGPSYNGLCSQDFVWGTGDWTIEMWIYNDIAQTNNRGLVQCSTVADQGGIQIEWHSATTTLRFYDYTLESNWTEYAKSNASTPVDTWFHFAMVRESGIFTMYIDGTAQTAVAGTSSNAMGNPTNPQFGLHRSDTGRYMQDSYLDMIRISNTARYTSNFTAPTTAFTNDANTLLLVQPDWDTGFGADSSGNGNNFDVSNFSVSDQVPDSPTNNFCTLNPRDQALNNTLREGNLKFFTDHGSTTTSIRSTQGMSTGKWYAEFYYVALATSNTLILGIKTTSSKITDTFNTSSVYSYAAADGDKWNGTGAAYGASFTVGDIIGIALDLDANTLTFYKNGVSQGTAFSGLTDVYAFWIGTENYQADVVCNWGQDPTFAGNLGEPSPANTDASGKGSFALPVPTGFKALCTDNFSSPSIALPDKNFNTLLYTGTGSARTVTGVGFDPDLIWIKNRGATANNVVQDRVRGGGYRLSTNTDEIEGTDPNGMTAFATDGFTIGGTGGDASYNTSSGTYVAWNWKANGSGSANTDGVINSTVSANTTAGFSIVKYSGSAVNNNTVGHGLSQAPELWILKNRTTGVSDWNVFTEQIDGSVDFLRLNTDGVKGDSGRTAPTASVFYVGSNIDQGADGDDYIAYCFHSVEGYSKVGSYVGNGVSNNGPFIYLGFKPAYLLVKNTSTAQWWVNFDDKRNTYNPITYEGYPNSDVAEGNNTGSTNGPGTWDFLSNGIKNRRKAAEGGTNTNGDVYLYYAVAESPFKTSNAR